MAGSLHRCSGYCMDRYFPVSHFHIKTIPLPFREYTADIDFRLECELWLDAADSLQALSESSMLLDGHRRQSRVRLSVSLSSGDFLEKVGVTGKVAILPR